MPRFQAVIPFDAEDLGDAKSFARSVRRHVRDSYPLGAEWNERNARLLKVRDPEAANGPSEDLVHAEAGD